VAAAADTSAMESFSLLDEEKERWICPASQKSLRTVNPIRATFEAIIAGIRTGDERGDGKDLISLAIGDPTASGNLSPCPAALEAIARTLQTGACASGYANSRGTPEARKAVAEFHNASGSQVDSENVIVASGCSGALELALTALLDPGTILLIPKPGFALYQVIVEAHGASVVHYPLVSDRNWECDFEALEELIALHGSNIRGMLVCNPSNPTGSVYSESHLCSLIEFAKRHRLPLVSDEIYGDLTFGNHVFHPLSKIAARLGRDVPVITTSGIAKLYLVPGWRVGWVVFQDNVQGSIKAVEAGAKRLTRIILGSSHLVQSVVPTLLDRSNSKIIEWQADLRSKLERQAYALCDSLGECPGLKVSTQPQGAMYLMVQIDFSQFDDSVQSDLEFCKLLVQEQNVFVLPGCAFNFPDAFRVVFCPSEATLREAANRIKQFCRSHILA